MKANAIYILLGYHIFTRTVCDYLDSDDLYYFLDAILIGAVGVYMFLDSKKDLTSWVTFLCILLLGANQVINTTVMMLGYEPIIYLHYFLLFCVCTDIGLVVWENRNKIKNKVVDVISKFLKWCGL